MAWAEGIELMKKNGTMRELLIRIDERVTTIQKSLDEHHEQIEKVYKDTNELKNTAIQLQTSLSNHINMHKRDIGIIGIGLTVLTIIFSVLFKFL